MNCEGKYFTYENYRNNYVKIHRGECSFCKCGQGLQEEILGGQNGQWSTAFNDYQTAHNHAVLRANQMQGENTIVTDCNVCAPF